MSHLVTHIQHAALRSENTLHVVAVVSNPVRFHSRYRLAREFIQRLASTPCVRLHIVEATFGDRAPEIADEQNPDHLIVRTSSEVWIKENLVNLGMRRALVRYPGAQYLAWVDADVEFRSANWAQETLHHLQHFALLQPWSDAVDLGPEGGVMTHFRSFGHQHQRGKVKLQGYEFGHTGYAWACTRRFWEAVGGLLDFAILGSADHHMAWSAIGRVAETRPNGWVSATYKRRCDEWQARAVRASNRQVGYVPGRIEHSFHGPKRRRFYVERWQILKQHGFDPDADLTYDGQGLLQLVGKPGLEQAIRLYNRSRHEDSIEEN